MLHRGAKQRGGLMLLCRFWDGGCQLLVSVVQALPRYLLIDFVIISYCDVYFVRSLTSQIQKFSPKNISDVAEMMLGEVEKKVGRKSLPFFFPFSISLDFCSIFIRLGQLRQLLLPVQPQPCFFSADPKHYICKFQHLPAFSSLSPYQYPFHSFCLAIVRVCADVKN